MDERVRGAVTRAVGRGTLLGGRGTREAGGTDTSARNISSTTLWPSSAPSARSVTLFNAPSMKRFSSADSAGGTDSLATPSAS
jgi:hypothetical protein